MNNITFLPQTLFKTNTNKLTRTHATETYLGTAFQTPMCSGETEKKKAQHPQNKNKKPCVGLPPGRDFLKASTSD